MNQRPNTIPATMSRDLSVAAPAIPVAAVPNLLSVPFKLRANDVINHVVSIDSRFRQRPTRDVDPEKILATEESSAADFYYTINPPIKNAIRIRITSIEFPNNYLFFTANRHNTSLRILYTAANNATSTAIVTIPDGNYTADDMVDTLNGLFQTPSLGLQWLSTEFDAVTGQFSFTGNRKFAIDTTYDSYVRPFDYGLPYYLGFTRKLHISTNTDGTWTLLSDQCAYFVGDTYLFLKVNDYNCVTHKTADTEVKALAKIVLREPKNYMVHDDYASQHSKEVVFPQPQNISRLHIQIVDAYGEPVELCSSNYSFSMEVLEIRNASLYSVVTDSLGLLYR